MAHSSSPVEPYSFCCGDGGEVGEVVFGGHGDGAEEEAGEGGVAVEDGAALGVDVEDDLRLAWVVCRGVWRIETRCGGGGASRTGASKGWKRKATVGVRGKSKVRASCSRRRMGASGRCGGVGGVGFAPVVEVGLGDVGEGGVELDADDLRKGSSLATSMARPLPAPMSMKV